jgi:enamine deaminase RidA (YjgF/YER057c/UK114 family)
MSISDDPEAQMRQVLANVSGALGACGSSLGEVYRYLLVVSHRRHLPPVMEVFKTAFGAARPTGTLIIAELIEPQIHCELEVSARKGWTSG